MKTANLFLSRIPAALSLIFGSSSNRDARLVYLKIAMQSYAELKASGDTKSAELEARHAQEHVAYLLNHHYSDDLVIGPLEKILTEAEQQLPELVHELCKIVAINASQKIARDDSQGLVLKRYISDYYADYLAAKVGDKRGVLALETLNKEIINSPADTVMREVGLNIAKLYVERLIRNQPVSENTLTAAASYYADFSVYATKGSGQEKTFVKLWSDLVKEIGKLYPGLQNGILHYHAEHNIEDRPEGALIRSVAQTLLEPKFKDPSPVGP